MDLSESLRILDALPADSGRGARGFARAFQDASARGECRCSVCLSSAHSTEGHPRAVEKPEAER